MPLCRLRAAARSGKAGHDPEAASCERQSCAACLLRFAQRMCPGASTLLSLSPLFYAAHLPRRSLAMTCRQVSRRAAA